MSDRFKSLRARLILILVLALAPSIAVVGGAGLRQRQRVETNVRSDAIRLAEEASDDQARLVEQARQLLVAVAQIPSIREHDTERCSSTLADIQRQYPYTVNLGVIRLDGSVACSALPFDESVNLADRGYFQTAVETRALSVGDYQVGRISGVPSINLGYPVRGELGKITGVAFAAVDLGWLNEVTVTAGLPLDSTVTLFDSGGTVLVRYPESKTWVGTTAANSELFQGILVGRGRGTAETSGLDGVDRLYGYVPLSDTPGQRTYLAVGIPARTAFAEVDAILLATLATLVVLTSIALAIAWFGGGRYLKRPLAALSDAADRLGQGDLGARTELAYEETELGRLAESFDRMAASLQEKQQERDEFQVALKAREQQYRHLFTEMHSAFALKEILYNDEGEPIDYKILEVNPAFEELVGKPAQVLEGRSCREASPLFQESHIEEYARVADGGEPIRFEDFYASVDKHLEVSAYSPQPGRVAVMATDISGRKRAEYKAQRQLQKLRALRAIDQAIASSLDPRVTFDVLLDQVTHQLDVDAASLLLYDQHTRTLSFQAGRGFRTDALRHSHLKLGEGRAGAAAKNRELVMVPDLPASLDGLSRSPLLQEEKFVSYYAAPLLAKGEVKGVLEVFHREPLDPDQDWIDFLEALAGQAAIAIDNANLFNELRLSNQELMEAYDTTLEGWAGALELRDDETEGHSARVTEVTVRLARKMGVPESEIVNIRRGALLHDIGKIGIPDEILLKQGPLAEQEWEIMRLHPVFAYELLAPIQFLRSSIDIPYAHHEHWDGNGYPRGLSGTGIPLAARIFAVVDVWDALRSDRPYRQAWDPDRVREYLQEQSGRQFDPKVVDAFLSMEGEVRRVHSRTPNPATSVVTGN
jgi:HD-GYP domain-containing protein (c-di-GMP phosphodiesterase class II)